MMINEAFRLQKYICLSLVITALCACGFAHGVVLAQESLAEISGFEPSEILSIEDGEELKPTDRNLIRMLYRAAKTSDQSFAKYAELSHGSTLEQIDSDERGRRLNVFRLSGRAKSVKVVFKADADDAGAKPSEIHPFCLLTIEDHSGGRLLVAVPVKRTSSGGVRVNVPRNWLKQKALDELVEFDGYFLAKFAASKLAETSDNELVPLFVANKIKWFPDHPNVELAIHSDHVLLARHQVNLTQRDIAAKNNNRQMQADEGDYFYQLLRATNQIERSEIVESAIDFHSLLQSPGESLARSVELAGRVRRVTKAQVTNPQQQKLIDADHYYVIDLLIPLSDTKVVVNTKKTKPDGTGDEVENGPSIAYDNRFPVTVCVAKLPCAEDELEKQNVIVNGFFFRLWNYPSAFVDERTSDSGAGQVCPLVVGLAPVIVDNNVDAGRAFLAQILLGLAGAVLLFALLAVWYLKRSDQKVGSAVKKNDELPDEVGEINF